MNKTISLVMVFLIVLSTFSIVSPQTKAESCEVITLPAGPWHPHGFIDPIDSTRLDRVDLDPLTSGDQQIVTVEPGEAVAIDCSAWLMGNPGEIRQLWFVYSWASSWPPWDAYTPVFDGHPAGSGTAVSDIFSVTAPSTPGAYKVWLCVESKYYMEQAVAELTDEPTMLPHACIIVAGAHETPLEVGEKAAVYVISQAIPECGGYKWSTPWDTGATYDRTADVASIGMFLVELYEQTGNPTYLEYAEGVARWIICKADPHSGGYRWATPDQDISSPGWWLSPCVSHIGEFLLRTYQVTGDTTYLDYAEGAAQWLTAMAYTGEPGIFIPYNPPNRYGTQATHGIAPGREACTVAFLLDMYQETGNADYLIYVEGTAEWLMSGPDRIAESGGYKWRHYRPYGTHYSIDGNSRIALFFYEIYQALGNAEYLEHANGAMTWLLSQAIVDVDKAKWPDNPGSGRYPVLPFAGSFCGARGPEPRVCDLLMVAYEVTDDSTYLEYARKHANWIISPDVAEEEGGGYKFPYDEGGSRYDAYQNARVYNFLTWMYDVTGETSYSEYANGALTWIVYNAEEADGGYKWRTLTYSPYYSPMLSPGAAGIGYYLISVAAPPAPPEDLDPWEYCPYVYLDNGYGLPWDTTPDLPVDVLYTRTYFWGDLRVIQYWFHWNVDYMWWLQGFAHSAYEYTMGWGWNDPLRQTAAAAGGADWEPIIIIVDDEGSIDYVLWRWHYNWLKFDLTVPGAGLFHPTSEETHIKLWWAIGSHTPLSKYFAIDIPILLKITSLLKNPKQFNPVIGQQGDFTKPPLYELYEQGITYPCGMQEWDEDLALNSGFNPSDLMYVNNPTIAYSELQPWNFFEDLLSIILGSPANILVTAPNGLRIGYDSLTQTIVNEIEDATYSGPGTEPQVVNIPSPLPGVYNIDIVGTDSGIYTITIWSMAADGSLAGIETHAGETVEGEVDCYSASISETGEMEVFSWEYVFEDAKRGTILKISTDDKYFQFVAPEKEFSIKEACIMVVCKRSIFIWHKDDEIKLVAIAINTRIDFCFAYAKDMQTGDKYLLIDKLGTE